jgi:hypothetical protein
VPSLASEETKKSELMFLREGFFFFVLFSRKATLLSSDVLNMLVMWKLNRAAVKDANKLTNFIDFPPNGTKVFSFDTSRGKMRVISSLAVYALEQL